MHQQALEAYGKEFGMESPDTLICINNLAIVQGEARRCRRQ